MDNFKIFRLVKYSSRPVNSEAFVVKQNKYAQNLPIIDTGLIKLI